MKSRFLVCYDYGMGGLWAFVLAESPMEIIEMYPELHVFSERPKGISEADEAQIALTDTYDIDDPPTGVLEVVLVDRD